MHNSCLPKLGVKYFDEIDWSNATANQLVSWAKELEKQFRAGNISALSRDQGAFIVKKARELGVDVRIDKGHPGTSWDMDHINIGPNTKYHIPLQPK